MDKVFQSLIANFRDTYGSTIVWKGNTYACTRTQLKREEMEMMIAPLGLNNAANADLWRVACNPTDFLDAQYPKEQDIISWDDGISNIKEWIIVDAGAPPMLGVQNTILLLVSRLPAPDSDSVASGGETGGGGRKVYTPPASAY